MPDQKPPRVDGDERATVLALLQFQRESLVRKVDGLDEVAARQAPVASGTTLLWLVEHLAYAEVLWIVHRFAGRPMVETTEQTLAPDDRPDRGGSGR